MKTRKYWEAGACPQEKREAMIREIESCLNGYLQRCYVRTSAAGDTYTTTCGMYNSGKKGAEKTAVVMRMSFFGTVCKVDLEYDTSRVVFNFILAAATSVFVIPAIGFCVTALLRLRAFSRLRKDLIGIMKRYAA